MFELGAALIEGSERGLHGLTFLLVRDVQPPALLRIGAALVSEGFKRRASLVVFSGSFGQAPAGLMPEAAVRFMARTQLGGGGAVSRVQLSQARAKRDGLSTLEQLGEPGIERTQLGLALGPECIS